MTILTIRTDKPEAEIGLFHNDQQLGYETWLAHRELSTTIHDKIKDLLSAHQKNWQTLDGIVLFRGPGSFTGLRIGAAVANTAAMTLDIPIVGSTNDDWAQAGLLRLQRGENDNLVVPLYGRDPHITAQKK